MFGVEPVGFRREEVPHGMTTRKTRTPEQQAAARANMAKGRAVREERSAAARAAKEAGEQTRFHQFRSGTLKVEDWDDEEIARGQLKDRAGGFAGSGRQRFSPREQQAIRRELLRRGQIKLENMYFEGLKILSDIMVGGESDKDRLKAFQLMQDRVAGKVPERVEVGGVDAFSEVLASVIDDGVLRDAEPGEVG